jgi:hypothetical protein
MRASEIDFCRMCVSLLQRFLPLSFLVCPFYAIVELLRRIPKHPQSSCTHSRQRRRGKMGFEDGIWEKQPETMACASSSSSCTTSSCESGMRLSVCLPVTRFSLSLHRRFLGFLAFPWFRDPFEPDGRVRILSFSSRTWSLKPFSNH